MKRLLCLFMACAAIVLSADFTGKWSGSIEAKAPDGTTHTQGAYLVLKQDAEKVTGTGGPDENMQFPLRNGVVDGNKLTGEVVTDEGRVYKLELAADGDTLTGVVRSEGDDGSTVAAQAKLTRLK